MQHRSKGGQSQVKGKFGKDPWATSNNRYDVAQTQPSVPQPSAQTEPIVKPTSTSFSKGGRKNQTKSTPATIAVKPSTSEKEDDAAIPTPIFATRPYYQVVAPNGHVKRIYEPIVMRGLEHLFKAADRSHGRPSSRSPAAAASQPHQSQTLATLQYAPRHESQQQRQTHAHELAALPRRSSALNRNPLKRSRFIAHSSSQSCCAREASDVKDDVDYADNEHDETSKSFQVGDIDGLKTFLRARIDELTMKPMRSMVTSWIKKLEPKRKGGYGPYHKMLPAAAPEATPPWWPRTVPYIEPAHLEKEGLMTLAIDIILQHRDIPVDELKRESPWTHQLQRVAEFEVSMLPAEQYSSSRNAAFSTAMKKRSEQEILPSLFDVMQSYEDHVVQYELWTYKDVKEAPKGKTITWQHIFRPVKQVSRAKRLRWAVQSKTEPLSLPKELTLEVDDQSSDDETVCDDTILKIATEIVRLKDLKAARRKARAGTALAKSTLSGSPERTGEESTPSGMGACSEPVTPQFHQTLDLQNAKSVSSSSFDQHMDHLCLKDETKGPPPVRQDRTQPAPVHPVAQAANHASQCHTPQNSFVEDTLPDEQDDTKSGNFTSSERRVQQLHSEAQVLGTPMQYHSIPSPHANHTLPPTGDEDAKGGSAMQFEFPAQLSFGSMLPPADNMQFQNRHAGYNTDALQSLQSMKSFPDLGPSHYTQFATHNYINPSDLALLNNCYPAGVQMGHSSYEATMAASRMDFTYSSNEVFSPMAVTVSSTPQPAKWSISGIRYEFTGLPR